MTGYWWTPSPVKYAMVGESSDLSRCDRLTYPHTDSPSLSRLSKLLGAENTADDDTQDRESCSPGVPARTAPGHSTSFASKPTSRVVGLLTAFGKGSDLVFHARRAKGAGRSSGGRGGSASDIGSCCPIRGSRFN